MAAISRDRCAPLDFTTRLYVINVKIRDGSVANRPIYVALAVTCEGERDIRACGRVLPAAPAPRPDQRSQPGGTMNYDSEYHYSPAAPGACPQHPDCVIIACRRLQCPRPVQRESRSAAALWPGRWLQITRSLPAHKTGARSAPPRL